MMRNSYYMARLSRGGLCRGEIYFAGNEGEIILKTGKKVSISKLLLNGEIQKIPYFEGEFVDKPWSPRKHNFQISLYDGLDECVKEVEIIESRMTNTKRLICLAKIECEQRKVQIDICNPYIVKQ